MNRTSIEWTDYSWQPINGCRRHSPGCENCYAERLVATRLSHTAKYGGLAVMKSSGPQFTGEVRLDEKELFAPLRKRAGGKVFTCDMSDLFYEKVPNEWIDRVFAVMALCPQFTFQVLTKRADRMREYLNGLDVDRLSRVAYGFFDERRPHSRSERLVPMFFGKTFDWWRVFRLVELRTVGLPLPNVWLGVSVENQQYADERIPELCETPAAVRFLSCEPLLGRLDVSEYLCADAGRCGEEHEVIDWVIVGGESGAGARPMHPDWVRALRDQCSAARVPLFFKQWGEYAPVVRDAGDRVFVDAAARGPKSCSDHTFDDGQVTIRIGKKAAGARLDGREHKEFPR